MPTCHLVATALQQKHTKAPSTEDTSNNEVTYYTGIQITYKPESLSRSSRMDFCPTNGGIFSVTMYQILLIQFLYVYYSFKIPIISSRFYLKNLTRKSNSKFLYYFLYTLRLYCDMRRRLVTALLKSVREPTGVFLTFSGLDLSDTLRLSILDIFYADDVCLMADSMELL